MFRPHHWLVASLAIIVAVLSCFLCLEHREVTVLRAGMMAREAVRGQTATAPRPPTATRKIAETVGHASDDAPAVQTPPPEKPRILSVTDRQIRSRLLQYQHWTQLGRKGDIIAGLNLPPETLAKFKDLLVERDYAESDARDAADHVGLNPDSSDATDAAGAAMEKIDEQIKALLGAADYQKYGELTGIDLAQTDLRNGPIVGYFVDAGLPLTVEQTSALARAFSLEISARASNGNGQIGEPDAVTGFNPSQKIILEQAAQVLSPAQLETLRNFFRSDNQLGALIKVSPSSSTSR